VRAQYRRFPGGSRNIAPQNITKVFPSFYAGFLLAPIEWTTGLSVAAVLVTVNWHESEGIWQKLIPEKKEREIISVPRVTFGSFRHVSYAS
jgi:hypothetical protein